MSFIDLILTVVLIILSLALILAFVRVLRGPSLPERVVALDLMSVVGIGFVTSYAMFTGQAAFLDIAVVAALLSFLGVIAFAHYIEKRV
ncbi:MAG: monovalent cation/H+ antiporter complex subunit F [Chloroflexota bacterium]